MREVYSSTWTTALPSNISFGLIYKSNFPLLNGTNNFVTPFPHKNILADCVNTFLRTVLEEEEITDYVTLAKHEARRNIHFHTLTQANSTKSVLKNCMIGALLIKMYLGEEKSFVLIVPFSKKNDVIIQ